VCPSGASVPRLPGERSSVAKTGAVVEHEGSVASQAGRLLRGPGVAPTEAQPVLAAGGHGGAGGLLQVGALGGHGRGFTPGLEAGMEADLGAGRGKGAEISARARSRDIVRGIEEPAPEALGARVGVEVKAGADAVAAFQLQQDREGIPVLLPEEKTQGLSDLDRRLPEIAAGDGAAGVEEVEGPLLEADRQGLADGVNVVGDQVIGWRQRAEQQVEVGAGVLMAGQGAQEQGDAIGPGALPDTFVPAGQAEAVGVDGAVGLFPDPFVPGFQQQEAGQPPVDPSPVGAGGRGFGRDQQGAIDTACTAPVRERDGREAERTADSGDGDRGDRQGGHRIGCG